MRCVCYCFVKCSEFSLKYGVVVVELSTGRPLVGPDVIGRDGEGSSNSVFGFRAICENIMSFRAIYAFPSSKEICVPTPLRGSPSLGGYGCPNPEVPRDLSSLPIYPPLCLLLSAAYFHPSTASEGALHEKLLPLCLLLASHGQPKTPRVGRAWRPFRRVVHRWSPVYQFGWYPNHLVGLLGIKRKGHSLGLGVKGGQRSWR
ncbi:hypothetical protein AVEN_34404-1 [Araneus ventricosus]|uniref:Uncharacterized protein n=1 Tax=Araneus ventricosus TaxID=182803 RepID=A0A4Y2G399_ARAVE|nr:hypothetical protein AVEN_34404-1 [Araneus ventricosus]